MKANFKAKGIEKIEFTAEITCTLEEWRELAKQLKEDSNGYTHWPATELRRVITGMVQQAEKGFYPESQNKS